MFTSRLESSAQLSAVAASQPLPDILASILSNNEPATAEATGETSDLQTEVGTFVSRAGHTNGLSSPADLSELNEHLLSRTYLVAGRKTAADVAVLGALHPWLAAASKEERLRYPALTRFLDLLQHDEAIVKTGLLQENKVEVDDVPKTQRTPAAAAKVKDSKAKAAVPEGAATAKKEKKPKEKAAEKPPAAGDGPPRPSHIDLRVGRIVDGAPFFPTVISLVSRSNAQSRSTRTRTACMSSRSTWASRKGRGPSCAPFIYVKVVGLIVAQLWPGQLYSDRADAEPPSHRGMQPQACQYARRQISRNGSLRHVARGERGTGID